MEEKETNIIDLKVKELRGLKLECDAISTCNATGEFEKDWEIRELGKRALIAVEDRIGSAVELLEAKRAEILARYGGNQNSVKEDPEWIKLDEEEFKLAQVIIPFEFDVIEVSVKRQDGKSFSDFFPKVKHVALAGKIYPVEPYDSFMGLLDRKIFKLKK